MREPECRLTKANKFYSGGNLSPDPGITVPTQGQLQPQEKKGFTFLGNQFPTLKAAETGSLNFFNQLTGGMPNIWTPSAAENRAVDQSTLAKEAAAGTAHTLGSVGRQVLAEDQYKIQRAGQLQGLQTGGLNQLLGVAAGKAGAVTQPILNMIQGLTGMQTTADIAGAQIGAQGSIAGKANQLGAIKQGTEALGTIIGSAAKAGSDERIKTKIRETGLKTPEGVPLKTWEYKTKPGVRFFGGMAQDIEKKVPSAVTEDPFSGIKFVDTRRFPITRISATKE